MQFYHTAQCHRCRKFWGSVQLACWLQECPPELLPWIECPFLYHKPSPKAFQRIWQYIQPASQTQTTCNHTSPGPPHPASSPTRDQPPGQLLQQSVCITKEFLHKLSETVSGICMLVVLIRVSTWLQFVIVTDLSGQMLTFDGVWHFGKVFFSRMNPGFHCTGQMADSVYGVMWVSGLLTSGPWWRLGYGMGMRMLWTTNTGAFYWWHFECTEIPWWDPEAHSCAIHPRPSPHVARICTQLLEAENIPVLEWPAYSSDMSPHWAFLGCSGSAYTTACSSSCQYPATSHSHWRGVDQHSTGHNQQPDQLYAKEMCCTAWVKCWSHQILTGFRTPPDPPKYSKTAQFRVAFYCGQPKAHLCNNHAVSRFKVQGLFIRHKLNYTGYNQKWNVNQVRSAQWTVQKKK